MDLDRSIYSSFADGFVRQELALAQEGRSRVDDQLNVPLEDSELLAEVELTTNLIIAASEADASLPQAEVDRLLGLDPDEVGDHAPIPIQKVRNA